MAGKFELYRDRGGEFRFRLKAGNGETILVSEGYKAKLSAVNGIASVKKNAADESRFVTKSAAMNGKPYFVLRAGNNEIIGKSEMYESDDACSNGKMSVMNNAPDASIDDQTS